MPEQFALWNASRSELPDAGLQNAGWEILAVKSFTSAGGADSEILPDGSLQITGKNSRFDTYTIVATTPSQSLTALRIEALRTPTTKPDARLCGPGRSARRRDGYTGL